MKQSRTPCFRKIDSAEDDYSMNWDGLHTFEIVNGHSMYDLDNRHELL